MALNSDTKMAWNCDSDKKGKYNKLIVKYHQRHGFLISTPMYVKQQVLKFRQGTYLPPPPPKEGLLIQTLIIIIIIIIIIITVDSR